MYGRRVSTIILFLVGRGTEKKNKKNRYCIIFSEGLGMNLIYYKC